MSKSYTPGLKILKDTNISKERLLPLKGNVHVKTNRTNNTAGPNYRNRTKQETSFSDPINTVTNRRLSVRLIT